MVAKKYAMVILRRLIKEKLYTKLSDMTRAELKKWHEEDSNKMILRKAFLEIGEIKKICPITILEDRIILPSYSLNLVYQVAYMEGVE